MLYIFSAFFIPPEKVPTFYDLLWIVGVNDFILKFIAVLAKITVTLAPAKLLPYQKRGKYYLFLEVMVTASQNVYITMKLFKYFYR